MLLLFLTLSCGACECREVLNGGAHPYASPVTVTAMAKHNTLHIEDVQYVFAVLLMKEKKSKTIMRIFLRPPFLGLEKTVQDLEMEQDLLWVLFRTYQAAGCLELIL